MLASKYSDEEFINVIVLTIFIKQSWSLVEQEVISLGW